MIILRSDARSVHLTNITLQSAGLYQCEVGDGDYHDDQWQIMDDEG